MTQALRKKLFCFLLAAIACLMLVLNVLTPFTADDYTYSVSFATGERIAGVGDILPSLVTHGRVMNGRYAPHWFVHLFTLLPDFVFDLCNTAVFVLLLLGMYGLARGQRRWDAALLLFLTALLFLLPPDFAGPMLWMAGSCNYLWLAAASIWLLKPFADALFRGRPTPGPGQTVALCLLGLWAGNTSENMSATLALLLFLCALGLWKKTGHAPISMLTVTASVLAGWLFLALAPGDRGRIGLAVSEGYGLSFLVQRFRVALELYREALLPLVAAWCLLLAFSLYRGLPKARIAFSGLMFLGGFLCNAVMAIADYYPHRTVLWPCLLTLLACAALAAPLGDWMKPVWRGAVACLCCLMLLSVLPALPDCYDRWRLNAARNGDIVAQRDAGAMDIQTFGLLSKSKYDPYNDLMELTTQAEYRVNQSMAKYYGVSSIVAERFE